MKNLTQLIQEQKEEFYKKCDIREDEGGFTYLYERDDHLSQEAIFNWHTSSLIAIIRSEIDRKKGMLKDTVTGREDGFCRCGVSYYECDCVGYNIAITEDISYLENVLQELDNN